MRLPLVSTANLSPRPICCNLVIVELLGLSLVNTKILGLSHPSRKAHLLKINLSGVSKLNNFSLSRKIKSICA